MKKRIRELAKQAKAEIRSEEEIEGVAYDNFDEQVMKKFAELIVKEEMENACKMKVLLKSDAHSGESWYDAKA